MVIARDTDKQAFSRTSRARSGVAAFASWRRSLDNVVAQIFSGDEEAAPDLVLMFVAREYGDSASELVRAARERTGARTIAGCFSSGFVGSGRELERTPGLSMLALWLPDTEIHPMWVDQATLEMVGVELGDSIREFNADSWFLLSDPFRTDVSRLISLMESANPGAPIIGGMAPSLEGNRPRCGLFLNEDIYADGALAIGLRGGLELVPVVSQACDPIGEAWQITEVDKSHVLRISDRPATDVLIETVAKLPPELLKRTKRHLLVGLAVDEYLDEFHRGDFLIRGVLGVEPRRKAIVVADRPRLGQTIQFQLRDPAAADVDLHQHLLETRANLQGREPLAAVLCTCSGRGSALFGVPDHDVSALRAAFGPIPVGGFSSAGEIGPTHHRTQLHSFAASIGLLVPRS